MRRHNRRSTQLGLIVTVFAGHLVAPGVARAGDGLDLLATTPAGLNLVVGVDMDRARKSPLFQVWREGLKKDATRKRAYDEFVRRLGFDPATDVESVLFTAEVGGKTPDPNFLTVAKGTFDAKKSYAALMKGPPKVKGRRPPSKPQVRKHQGVKYLVTTDSGRELAVAVTKGRAFIGAEGAVKAGLDLLKGVKGATSVEGDSRLVSLAKRATASKGAAWIAVVLPDTIQPDPKLGAAGALATARDIFGTVAIAKGLDVSITSICPDEGIAAGLQQALMIAVASAQRNPALAKTGAGKVLASLKTAVKGRDLVTSLTLDDAEFQGVIDQVAAQVSRPRAPRAAQGPQAPAKGRRKAN